MNVMSKSIISNDLLISILLICFSSFFFAVHDSLLKYISLGNIKWYHNIVIGGPFGFIILILMMIFSGGVKKNIILKSYKIPILRGMLSIANPLMAFMALKYISLSIFTTLILTLPFFLVILSYYILNEKIKKTIIYSLIIGFIGVIIILKPEIESFNFYILLPILMSAISGINMIIVNKYKSLASPYGFAFYNLLIPFLLGVMLFINEPFFPDFKTIIFIISSWIFGTLGLLFLTYAYHRSNFYTNRIAPYIYTQLIWAIIFGFIFYKDLIDIYSVIGSIFIVVCGINILILKKA